MPRVSERKKSLRFVKHKVDWNIALQSSSSEHDSDSSVSSMSSGFDLNRTDSDLDSDDLFLDSSNSEDDSDFLELEGHPTELIELYFVMSYTRYHFERKVTPKSKEFCRTYFDELPVPMFRQMVRMDKATFFHLVELIENHPVFLNESRYFQAPIEWQLAVTLDRLGYSGNGACLVHLIPIWGVSNGSIINFTSRCFVALESALKDSTQWPDAAERHQIQLHFSALGFPDCVGLIDGSLLPLAQCPAVSGECYFDKKSRYSINAQVICDHRRKILFLFAGMPGSCSDITCLKKSDLGCRIVTGEGFTGEQYLLGDSGYMNAPHMVCLFKRGDNSIDKGDFNTCVAKARVTNEHCIGVLKARWFSLKEIRTQLNLPKDSVHMVKWIGLCAKLYNYVISMNDAWTEADGGIELEVDADDIPGLDEEFPVHGPQLPSTMLMSAVMNHALNFNRAPGGCLNENYGLH